MRRSKEILTKAIFFASSFAVGLAACGWACSSKEKSKRKVVVEQNQSGAEEASETEEEEDQSSSSGSAAGTPKPKASFLNLPAAGADVVGHYNLKVKIENYPETAVWNLGYSKVKNETAAPTGVDDTFAGTTLFDLEVNQDTIDLDTFAFSKGDVDYYLFIVVVRDDGFADTYFSEGKLRIRNAGVPIVSNLQFFADAEGDKVDPKPYNCCVFTADGAKSYSLSFNAVDPEAEPLSYKLDLRQNEESAWTLVTQTATDFVVDAQGNGVVSWVPAANLPLGTQYQLRLTVSDSKGLFNEAPSPKFGLTNAAIPTFTSLQASGNAFQTCANAGCHNPADVAPKGNYNGTYNTTNGAIRSAVDLADKIYNSVIVTKQMPKGIEVEDAKRTEVELWLKARSPN